MLFDYLDTREATAVGTALADEFVARTPSRSGARSARREGGGDGLDRSVQRFLRQVDQATQHHRLNFFKRAKLANTFKWRLLEKGIDPRIVDDLTRELLVRLSTERARAATAELKAAPAQGRSPARNARLLRARSAELLAARAYSEAFDCLQELLSIDSRDAAVRNDLGAALLALNRYQDAEDQFRRAIGLRSGFAEAHFNLGCVLHASGRHHEAETSLQRALKFKPSHIEARIKLGMVLTALGRVPKARDCYEKALRAAPRSAHAWVGLGQLHAIEGQLAEAEVAYRRAAELDSRASAAWAALAGVRKMTPADAPWLERAEALAASALPAAEEATLRFAMGKFCDDVGDYARAFRNYQRANELHKGPAAPFARDAHARAVDGMMRIYTPEAFAKVRAAASDSQRPVFVVGMPRSGTTLVAQIIGSHRDAKAVGELAFWAQAVHKNRNTLAQDPFAATLTRNLAAEYQRLLSRISGDALRVVDKAPVNFAYVGLIHSVFPRARVICLKRDPIDNCLSCYFQQFSPAMNFTMDLTDLADYYREYHRLMGHWHSVLPPSTLLEVPYAGLVDDQELWTRRILDFLGLPWDDRCLDFHQTVRPVVTASLWQVRQRIYRTSVGRWRNYEKFIGPLRALRALA